MFYERKVRYLEYYEGGERVKGSGFAKLEARDGGFKLEVKVTGLHRTDTFARDVLLCGKDREGIIGRIEISEGRGEYRQQWRDAGNIGGTGIGYRELQGIRVPLGAGREISCRWETEKAAGGKGVSEAEKIVEKGTDETKKWREQEKEAETETAEERIVVTRSSEVKQIDGEITETEIAEEEDDGLAAENFDTDIGETESAGGKVIEMSFAEERAAGSNPARNRTVKANVFRPNTPKRVMDDSARRKETSEGGEIWAAEKPRESNKAKMEHYENARKPGETDKAPIQLMEDKWAQIWAIYPHIRPFQDEREYLSIGPSDFVLFPEASYRTVNNSFLLHGYYNYRHLLLTRVERKDGYDYYIGVPGNFFEREKQVAIMFGFESFECAEEPAQPGDFGYYMMRTQL